MVETLIWISFVLAFFLLDVLTIVVWWKDRVSWAAERRDLLNRIQSPDLASYIALRKEEEDRQKDETTIEEPFVPRTVALMSTETNPDKGWFA